MTDHDEQAIRELAYGLWEKEGSPEGRDLEFWERARLLLEAQDAPAATTGAPSADDDGVDTAMEESFPASDPPSFTADRGAMTK